MESLEELDSARSLFLACHAFVKANLSHRLKSEGVDSAPSHYTNSIETKLKRHISRNYSTIKSSQAEWILNWARDEVLEETEEEIADCFQDIGDEDVPHFARCLFIDLMALLEDCEAQHWIACIPLERSFQKFPEVMALGNGWILNPVSTGESEVSSAFQNLRRLLTSHCGVNFTPDLETFEPISKYEEQIAISTAGFIPLRPLLIFKFGVPGHCEYNLRYLYQSLSRFLPQLRLVQFIIESKQTAYWGETSKEMLSGSLPGETEIEHSVMPNGQSVPCGRIELPNACLVMNAQNGGLYEPLTEVLPVSAHITDPFPDIFLWIEDKPKPETPKTERDRIGIPLLAKEGIHKGEHASIGRRVDSVRVPDYTPNDFQKCWHHLIGPVLHLETRRQRSKEMNTSLQAIQDSITIVGQCHRNIEDNPVFRCVAAIERLVASGSKADLAERFALAVSVMTEDNVDARPERYRLAKKLYEERSQYVHQCFIPPLNEDAVKLRKLALECYCAVLKQFTRWAERGENQSQFQSAVMRAMFQGKPWME